MAGDRIPFARPAVGLAPPPASVAGGVASLGDIWTAGYEQMRLVENTLASEEALTDAYEDWRRAIKAGGLEPPPNPMTYVPSADGLLPGPIGFIADAFAGDRDRRRLAFQQWVNQQAAQLPAEATAAWSQRDPVQDAKAKARAADAQLGALLDSNPGWDAYAASFGGAALAALRDPVTLGSLFFGGGAGASRTVAGRILTTAAGEAGINAGTEAAMQPFVQNWRARAGLDHGLDQATANVLFAAGLGGLLGGTLRAGGEAFDAFRARQPAEVRGALDVVELDEHLTASNPVPPLDMEANRRIAAELGYTVLGYHGSGDVITGFDPAQTRLGRGVFFSAEPDLANRFALGQATDGGPEAIPEDDEHEFFFEWIAPYLAKSEQSDVAAKLERMTATRAAGDTDAYFELYHDLVRLALEVTARMYGSPNVTPALLRLGKTYEVHMDRFSWDAEKDALTAARAGGYNSLTIRLGEGTTIYSIFDKADIRSPYEIFSPEEAAAQRRHETLAMYAENRARMAELPPLTIDDPVRINRLVEDLAPAPASITQKPGYAPPPAPDVEAILARLRGRVADEGAPAGVKRPITTFLRATAQIDPTSPIAAEFRARGIDPRTFPGLFKHGGRKALDNIPFNELPPELRTLVRDAPDGYVPEQAWIDAVEAERGKMAGGVSDAEAEAAYYARQGVDVETMTDDEIRARLVAIADAEQRYRAAGENDEGLGTDEFVALPPGLMRREYTADVVGQLIRANPGWPDALHREAAELVLFGGETVDEAIEIVASKAAGVPRETPPSSFSHLGSDPPDVGPDRLDGEPGDDGIDFTALREAGFDADTRIPFGDELVSLDELEARLEESRWLERVVSACKL